MTPVAPEQNEISEPKIDDFKFPEFSPSRKTPRLKQRLSSDLHPIFLDLRPT